MSAESPVPGVWSVDVKEVGVLLLLLLLLLQHYSKPTAAPQTDSMKLSNSARSSRVTRNPARNVATENSGTFERTLSGGENIISSLRTCS